MYSNLISVALLESQATGDYTFDIVVSRKWGGIKVEARDIAYLLLGC